MKFETRQRITPTINLAALIDVVFILVIFIVLGANFHRIQTLDVSIPEAESANEAEIESLVITIPVTGAIEVAGEKVELSELRRELQSKASRYKTVLLVADRSVPVQRVVTILSDAQAVGFTSVSIATQAPQGATP
ncbi:Biopolymer transport protein ExbD [Nitrosomonas nitrosa]|uniref:Biopolymer transport protein ExbD n=1 Tax=Nitrosomonas nitrosa TaxID=52442 RepID=A0A1I4SGV4_9PROT|nr:biopolymer transporter ExbD [Nitrosomonas nitrosa]CAE6518501.1 Biopolymer transport protein ExbD [Nitrosomonas nitrosa]SFM63689.1 biopolymer transport protein ExbD [Nitrosomonas nitrosa]